jgi:hypothetical protein
MFFIMWSNFRNLIYTHDSREEVLMSDVHRCLGYGVRGKWHSGEPAKIAQKHTDDQTIGIWQEQEEEI